MPLSVVILAAGQGRRMNSDLPKVLQPLGGEPLLQHVIRAARSLDPQAVYVVYGHGGAAVQAALAHEAVDWVLQAEQLGTGHALMQAMPLIPDEHDVLVLYGDVPLILPQTLIALARASAAGALALLTATLEDPSGYGRILRGPRGEVLAIVEQGDASAEERAIREVNTGIMAAPAASLRRFLLDLRSDNAQHEFYLTDVVGAAAGSQLPVTAVGAAEAAEALGVNDRVQLAAAESRLRRRRARELMLAGATLADPERIDIRGEVLVGRDVFIDAGVVFEGRVELGARVRVGPGCRIRNARIGDDTEILDHCLIEDATVAQRCRVGPFARLRPQTKLHDEVHIGNFVEIKASELGTGSKANHLTYLGDSRVGRDVNVGAGSITCNYDGANKWPTTIEDGAFIGSGAMLVAPVRIGAGATVGAGSTITTDVADGKLTLTRATQTTLEGWQRPGKLDAAARAERLGRGPGKPRK